MNLSHPYLLYAVTDCLKEGISALEDQITAAIQGGITCLQFREKNISKSQYLQIAGKLKSITDRYQIPLIINDYVDIAGAIDAAGVHIGQKDLSVSQARKILGDDKIIGVSARNIEQAKQAENNGASYLGVGAIFGTTTKADAKPLSYEELTAICHAVSIPVVAIGGIHAQNIHLLKGSGISGAAIVSGIFSKPNIVAATQELYQKMEQIIG